MTRYMGGPAASKLRARRSANGRVMYAYEKALARVSGTTGLRRTKTLDKYVGLPIVPRDEYLEWIPKSNFQEIYNTWVEHDYARSLVPTLDRIDSNKGYTLDNIRWLSFNENTRRNSPLNDIIVTNILKDYIPKTNGRGKRTVARKHGVSSSTIQDIINKVTWKHING